MKNKILSKNLNFRLLFLLVIISYHFTYAIWKQHLVLSEDFGPGLIDGVLFVSAILLLINNRWINRFLLGLNILALIAYIYYDIIRNCQIEHLSEDLYKCGWFSLENIWLPWWLVYWFLQITLIIYLIFSEKKNYNQKRKLT